MTNHAEDLTLSAEERSALARLPADMYAEALSMLHDPDPELREPFREFLRVVASGTTPAERAAIRRALAARYGGRAWVRTVTVTREPEGQ